eukprot:CAMPEP_0184645436 /NCGR_PEP_ID=MMETSP0308-20130426/1905_1 /TAXON_ID=38269 /ORGANISM="Gloeochaete witrockiana, Strain SAG 46.84" /LENGTH=317 /DNA_ID=CAMNT_0027074419 /DNA_START=94 /DNA_END=1047 /DNA_ORIENTATION=+
MSFNCFGLKKKPAVPIYKIVAIAGATGGVGEKIATAILKSKLFEVKILVRAASVTGEKKKQVDDLVKLGAKLVTFATESLEEAVKCLTGVEVVVSALSGTGLGYQPTLIQAAKTAGVKLFIPSDYGIDIYSPDTMAKIKGTMVEGFFAPKLAAIETLKKVGLDYTIVLNGFFTDTTFFDWIGFDALGSGKVLIAGDGKSKISFTSRDDVAKYIVEILKNADKYKNKIVKVSGDHKSYDEVVKTFEDSLGKKLEVTYKPLPDLKKEVAALPHPYANIPLVLQLALAWDICSVDFQNNNKEFAVKPITVKDFVATVTKK